MEVNAKQTEIASFIGKLLRDHFGKGPEAVFVCTWECFVTIYIRGFLSPTEKVLMAQKQEAMLQKTRDLVMQTLIPEIKAYVSIVMGVDILEFYYDWGLHNRSAMFVAISGGPVSEQAKAPGVERTVEADIQREVIQMSKQSEREPDNVYSYSMNHRTLLVVREGILVAIEKELIRQGMGEQLRLAKRALEKGLLHNNNHFESLLNAKVQDIFVDWDFDRDKSVIVFCM